MCQNDDSLAILKESTWNYFQLQNLYANVSNYYPPDDTQRQLKTTL